MQKWHFSCFTTYFVSSCVLVVKEETRDLRLHPTKRWALWPQDKKAVIKKSRFKVGTETRVIVIPPTLKEKLMLEVFGMTGTAGLITIHRLRGITVFLKNLFRKASPFVTSPVVNASFILIAQKGCSCSPWFCTGPSSNELKDIRKKGAIAHNYRQPKWKEVNKNHRIKDLVWDL